MFPAIPPHLMPTIWDIALGDSKTERPAAQAALDSVPGKEQRIIAALRDGKQAIRASAATWLARLDCREAIEPIKRALAKEKQEFVNGAQMSALETLGVPIDQFLDRDRLSQEADNGLNKGMPRGLEWFPFDLIPAVRWADRDQAVDPKVLQWFIVSSCKLKSPQPSPILRRYCDMMRREDAELLGKFVLDAWIGHDTITYTRDEVADACWQQAQQFAQWAKQYPEFHGNKTQEQYFEEFLAAKLNECRGSAIKEKGVLAIPGACGGPYIAAAVDKYIRRWYGMRVAQAKALLQMLCWVDDPMAIQVLLAFAARFRTAGIRKEAEEQAQILAERKGWTLAELADRTIPTAGFESDGSGPPKLMIDYGQRQFTVTLDGDLNPVITNPDGKTIKSLPSARKSEDDGAVKAAQKTFNAARKQLRSAVKLQSERFFEAMCTQRNWPVRDWRTYMAEHPIAGRFCQRVVWSAHRVDKGGARGELIATFRPLGDGTLTNVDDEPVVLPEDAIIRIAHDCNVPQEVGSAWIEHLRDYEVDPLFDQFGKEHFTLRDAMRDDTELNDFEGHLLGAFKLRGRANKLNYTRGQAEDGGFFYTYEKHFPTLELEAIIEFSGNGLPEQDVTVALTKMYFCPTAKGDETGWARQPVPLKDVPPVLLGEVWNDVKSMAELGPGFDPRWHEKLQW